MLGFVKLQGANVTFKHHDADPAGETWLNNSTYGHKTFAATDSLKTDDGSTLGIGENITLELTTQQFQDGITDIASANNRTPEQNEITTNLKVASGGSLKVLADPWRAKNIDVESGASLDMVTSQLLSTNELLDTHVQLSAQNLTLNGTLTLSGANTSSSKQLSANEKYALDIAQDFTIGQTGKAQITNNKLQADVLNLQGSLSLDNSVANFNTLNASSNGSFNASNATISASSSNLNGGATMNLQAGSNLDVSGDIRATGSDNRINLVGSNLTANKVFLSTVSQLQASEGSKLTLSSLHNLDDATSQAATQNASLNNQVNLNNSVLTIEGDNDQTTADLTAVVNLENNAKIDFTDAVDTLALQYNSRTNNFTVGQGFNTIRLDMGNLGVSEIGKTAQQNLFELLVAGEELLDESYFILDNITISDIETGTDEEGNSFIDFEAVKDKDTGNLDWNFEADNTQDSILINVNTQATIAGGFKAVETANTQNTQNALDSIKVAADKTLNIYGNYKGNIISNVSGQTVGADLEENANLGLLGSGSVGEITGSGIINIGKDAEVKVVASADNSKPSKITGHTLNSSGTLTVDSINLTSGNLNAGSVLNTKELTVNQTLRTSMAKLTAESINTGLAYFDNSLVTTTNLTAHDTMWTTGANTLVHVTDTLHIKNGLHIQGDSVVQTDKLLVTGTGDLNVGVESKAGSQSSSGKLVANKLDLNGNTLVLDPEFGLRAASAFVQAFADLDNSDQKPAANGVFNFNGSVIVGRNSAFGLGGEEATFYSALKEHQDNSGSLDDQGAGALAFVNQADIALNGHKLIVGSEDVDKLKEVANSSSDAIYLGQSSGLKIGTEALAQLRQNNTSLVFNDLDQNDYIRSTEGKLIVPAGITNEEVSRIFGTEVQLASGSVINVQTENGAYQGVIDSTDDLHGKQPDGDHDGDHDDSILTPAPNIRQILSKMSTPTFNYYTKKMEESSVQRANSLTTQADGSVKNEAYDYIRAAGSTGDGAALEHAARLGALGVGAQVANQVTKASLDTIKQRLNLETASQDAGSMDVLTNNHSALWMSSIYQDFSADEFGADDLTYGSDIDLYGLAMGFDYAMATGLKIGAMVNVGKGEAAGTGVAAGVKNDFKYYGAGIFASIQPMRNFILTADATYTVVDNDLASDSGLAEFGYLNSTMDSIAWSAGLNSTYTFNLGPLHVSPHVGVRYTSLDLANYDVKVDGIQLAHTENEKADVISVPVGLSLSANLSNGDWIIQPSADFTVTKNFGDTNLLSVTTFDQQTGDIHYQTEFVDDLSYGATAGMNIQKGNFSLGAKAGYTKSSHTDELSVGANVRFLF